MFVYYAPFVCLRRVRQFMLFALYLFNSIVSDNEIQKLILDYVYPMHAFR